MNGLHAAESDAHSWKPTTTVGHKHKWEENNIYFHVMITNMTTLTEPM